MRLIRPIPFVVALAITVLTSAQTLSKEQRAAIASEELRSVSKNGGVEILSDTQGVDFKPYLETWRGITKASWLKQFPDGVPKHPVNEAVMISFKIRPSGQVMDRGMVLEVRTGIESLDKAAWYAITSSKYPSLPRGFHGPYLELRTLFRY